MKYEKNIKEKLISSFQFLKYHNLDKITMPNIIPMFYGKDLFEKEDLKSILKYY